jgi:hypothetical protein
MWEMIGLQEVYTGLLSQEEGEAARAPGYE